MGTQAIPAHQSGEQVNPLLDAALAYAARHWAVVPVHTISLGGHCTCLQGVQCRTPGKHPRIKEWEKKASTDPQQIKDWWDTWPDSNVGIVTGQISGGLVVIDIDPRSGGDELLNKLIDQVGPYPPTLACETGGGGEHLYLHTTETIKSFDLGKGLEIKGEGKMVVAPPSIHLSGNHYSWKNATSSNPKSMVPAEINSKWLPILTRQVNPFVDLNEVVVSDGSQFIPDQATTSQRHLTLMELGKQLRKKLGLSQPVMETLLLAYNQAHCLPPKPAEEPRRVAQWWASKPALTGPLDLDEEPDPQLVQSLGIITFGEMDLTVYDDGPEILHALYAGELAQINALPDAGKSTFALNLALSMACGRPYPPLYQGSSPRRVAYLDFENRHRRFQRDTQWMRRQNLTSAEDFLVQTNCFAGVDLTLDHRPFLITDNDCLKALVQFLRQHQIEFAVIDTLSQSASMTDENNNAEMQRKVLSPLKRVGQLTGTAFLVVHHKGKGKDSDDDNRRMYASRGASSLPAAARLILDLEPAVKGQRDKVKLRCAKVKGEKFKSVILQLDQTKRWFELTDEAPATDPAELILGALEIHGDLAPKDLLDIIGDEVSRATMFRKLGDLIQAKKVEKTTRGLYHRLEDADPIF